ncbi:MAG: hypothetical protein ABSB42_19500 [Tepidisphaeraceae bacterium]|jgi:hypothetical protein
MDFVKPPDSVPMLGVGAPATGEHRRGFSFDMKIAITPIICTLLFGCFLLGAVALHDYLMPVFGRFSFGEHAALYTVSGGHIYIWAPEASNSVAEFDRQLNKVSPTPAK